MQKLLSTLFFLFLFSSCFSQNTEEKNNVSLKEIRKNKYQVELGLNSIRQIWSNPTGASLIFKKTYSTGKMIDLSSVKMLRGYFSFNTQINFEDDPARGVNDTTGVMYHPSNETEFTLGFGFEKQIKNKSFVHYYGNDFFGQYLKWDDDASNGSFGGVVVNYTPTTDRLIETVRGGINPFMGLKYYLTPQFSVGIETGLQLYYFQSKFTELRSETIFVNNLPETSLMELKPVKSKGLGGRFNGVRFITLAYSF